MPNDEDMAGYPPELVSRNRRAAAEHAELDIGRGGRMTEETSEALRRWDALPEGLRHPKNLAMLAIEHLVLPDDHPCRILVLQDADYRNPKVSVFVELPGDAERTVEILDGDDPLALAARIRDAADDLVDGWPAA